MHHFLKCILELAILELVHLLKDLNLAEVGKALLPVRPVQLSGSKNNIVSARLRQELYAFLVVLVNKFPKVLADDLLLDRELVRADVRDLQEHRGRHVYTIQGFQIDVHMRWSLQLDIIIILLNLPYALGETLLEPWG